MVVPVIMLAFTGLLLAMAYGAFPVATVFLLIILLAAIMWAVGE